MADDKNRWGALPIIITIGYLAFGVAWIFFSDLLVSQAFRDSALVQTAQTYKGWFFVLITSVLLYVALRKSCGRITRVQQELVQEKERLGILFDHADEGIFILEDDFTIVKCNAAAAAMYGFSSCEELVGHRPIEFADKTQQDGRLTADVAKEVADGLKRGDTQRFVNRFRKVSGEPVDLEVCCVRTRMSGKAMVLAVVRDVSERMRQEESMLQEAHRNEILLDLYAKSHSFSDEELYAFVLEHAVSLTESKIGFLHLISEDGNSIILTTWNGEAMSECHTAPMLGHYPLESAGIWAHCVHTRKPFVVNDYANEALRNGVPEGHVPMVRFMSIPVVENGRVKIIFGVGNKEEVYNAVDVTQVELVANELHKILIQRHLADELRDREATLSEAQHVAHIGSWVHDIPFGTMVWSKEVFHIFGVDPESFEPTHERLMDMVHPDDKDWVLAAYMKSLKNHTPHDVDHRIVLPNGEIRHVYERCEHSYDDAGNPLRSVGTIQDITEYRRALDAEQQSMQNYRLLFENMMTGFALHEIICDEDGTPADYRYLEVNPAFEEMVGVDAEKLIGSTVKEVFPDIDPFWIENFGRVALTRQAVLFENYFEPLNRHFEVWAYSPRENQFAVVCLDVTERKMAAEEMRHAKEQLQYILNNSHDAIFQIDLQGKYTYANDAASLISGYSVDELLRMNMRDLAAPAYHEVVFGRLRDRMNGGHDDTPFAIQIIRKDGRHSWFELKTSGVYDDNGVLVGVQGVARDATRRIQAEEALRASELLRKKLLETIPDPIWLKDPDGVYLGCNHAFERLVGQPESVVLGQTAFDLFDRDLAGFFQKNDRIATEAGQAMVSEEYLVFAEDGYEGTFETIRTPLMDADNHLIGVLGIARDITERKRMKEALEKRILSLTRPLGDKEGIEFEDLFDLKELQRIQDEFSNATGVAAIIVKPNGERLTQYSNLSKVCGEFVKSTEAGRRLCDASDRFISRKNESSFNIHRCEGCGLKVAGVSIVVGGKHVASWLIGQVRDGSQSEATVRARAKTLGVDPDGFFAAFKEVPIMTEVRFEQIVSALLDFAGQMSNAAYMNLQQARFIAEEKVRSAELQRLSTAINQAAESVVITDSDGRIEYVNPAFERTTGYTREEAIGKFPRILKSGVHGDAFYKNMWRLISSGKPWSGQVQNRRKDGTLYVEESTISPICDADGKIINYVAVKHDVTRELRLEEQFRQSQKMEAVGRLAGGVAHDFNNILQTILGSCGILLMETEGQEVLQQDIREIRDSAKRAGELTRQLLAFSRKQPVIQQVLDLNELIGRQTGMLSRLLGSRFTLVFEGDPSLRQVRADAAQMEQVIMNLVVNARDAMPEGGRILITTHEFIFKRDDTVIAPKSGEFACVRVKDAGMGMEQNVLNHLFDPFFTTKPVGQGTGLGLSVSYGIIEQHHGWIDVKSVPGEGSIFSVYLPVVGSGERERDEIPDKPSCNRTQKRQRILLVEDDPQVMDMVGVVLREAGYDLVTADTIQAARDHFLSEGSEFDLLLSDVVLPDGSGVDMADEFSAEKPELSVIMFSGYSDIRVQTDEINTRGYYFLRKPFGADRSLTK
ncbi:MAG: PAS domain S-box protein [Pontiellaceae bacterium]|nr:PAS domain S-box protein [Pontiellaceae bacterium]MBN2783457.1 PAS domain S-box protein [Pontiellaceae bacterium]